MGNKISILCFNAPPFAGKDEAARVINEDMNGVWKVCKFASPLDAVAKVILNLENDEEAYQYWREKMKDEPLMNHPTTMRKLLISISENTIKPQMGKSYFGEAAADRTLNDIRTGDKKFIFTDCGFQYEFDSFKEKLLMSCPTAEIQLVQIHRPGCDFSADSREYVEDESMLILKNDIGLKHYKSAVLALMANLSSSFNCTNFNEPNSEMPNGSFGGLDYDKR